MRIIVAGCGKLGTLITENLVQEGNNVSVIDKDEQALDKLSDNLDVLTVKGSCVSVSTLEEADIRHTDILIATTISDETNMLCCLIGKKMGAKYTCARIRDPEYLGSLNFITGELGLDNIVNPDRATAREISRMLRLPFASGIETFSRGLVEMVEIRVGKSEIYSDIPLNQLYTRYKDMPHVLFCAVERDGKALIPKRDFVIREGDSVFVCADPATVTAFFRYAGKNTRSAKDALIVGGSRIAYYLAGLLSESHVKTKIIELDSEKAHRLDEELNDTIVIEGDGTDRQFLLSEGLKTCDAFITLTGRDEENIMAGLYARTVNNGQVIVKNNRANYTQLLSEMGFDGVISPTRIACNIILRAVRARANSGSSSVERMYKIMNDRAEAIEFIAANGASYLGRPLSELKIDDDAIVAVIVHDNKVHVPFGKDVIQSGDRVLIVTKDKGVKDLADVLE